MTDPKSIKIALGPLRKTRQTLIYPVGGKIIAPSGQNASEVLADEGLGRAVKYDPNIAGYATVVAAEQRAKAAGLGLHSGACG